jgi:4-diphosphocytidyl-2C-methyl-D-erythritol kinase
VLLKPREGLSAGAVYKNLKLVKNENKIQPFIDAVACEDIPFILNNLYNKLEESSFQLLPSLEAIKDEILTANPYSLMSGSGTTFFAIFTDISIAEEF